MSISYLSDHIDNSEAASRVYSVFNPPKPLYHLFFFFILPGTSVKFLLSMIGSSASNFIFAPYCVLVCHATICIEIEKQYAFANEEICVVGTPLVFSQFLDKCRHSLPA